MLMDEGGGSIQKEHIQDRNLPILGRARARTLRSTDERDSKREYDLGKKNCRSGKIQVKTEEVLSSGECGGNAWWWAAEQTAKSEPRAGQAGHDLRTRMWVGSVRRSSSGGEEMKGKHDEGREHGQAVLKMREKSSESVSRFFHVALKFTLKFFR